MVMKVGNYTPGIYMLGAVIIGFGLGWLVHNLIACTIIGIGVGYILDKKIGKHGDSGCCGGKTRDDKKDDAKN